MIGIVILTSGCSNLLYYPTRDLYVDVKELKPAPEEHQFVLKNGLDVHGWYFHSPIPPKAVVLFFHGNAQNRSSHFTSLFWLVEKGYDLAVFTSPLNVLTLARHQALYIALRLRRDLCFW